MNLNFKKFGEGFPLIILHGLMGSLDNWNTIARKLSEDEKLKGKISVYIIDQRNHGKSPHTDEFSYNLMAADLLDFMQQHAIDKAHLIGHSMGGKVVMKFALEHPDKVGKLIVVDMAPEKQGEGHDPIFEALFEAKAQEAATRHQVQQTLESRLGKDPGLIGFLMKNLERDASGNHFEWKFNLASLYKNYENISAAITSNQPFSGEAMFLQGEKSDYINSSNYTGILQLFPNAKLVTIPNAGHWVHADSPEAFMEAVRSFLLK